VNDTSIPTPAIVDARLIEAPFEVAVMQEHVRRGQGESTDEALSGANESRSHSRKEKTATTREQKRSEKQAARESQRQAKLDAQRQAAEAKNAAKEAKRSQSMETPGTEPRDTGGSEGMLVTLDELLEESPPSPEKKFDSSAAARRPSSFDELMGYSGE
jgi:multidrug efflux pump subunit AcrA (membrane-fusion protein)